MLNNNLDYSIASISCIDENIIKKITYWYSIFSNSCCNKNIAIDQLVINVIKLTSRLKHIYI